MSTDKSIENILNYVNSQIYPVRPSCSNFPSSHPSTSPSEQNPDIPTPPERSWWPHPWMSPVPKTRNHILHVKLKQTFLTNK